MKLEPRMIPYSHKIEGARWFLSLKKNAGSILLNNKGIMGALGIDPEEWNKIMEKWNGHETCLRWIFTKNDIEGVIKELEPYLIMANLMGE